MCEMSVSQGELERCWEQLALRPMVGSSGGTALLS